MPDPLRDIILDFREGVLPALPTGVPRRVDVTPVPGKATVCIGPRRAGKSTFLFQQVQKLLDGGVPRDSILYVNFFDDRLRHLRHEGLGAVADAYFSLHPEKKHTETVYCFFDEIQVVPGWEAFVDRLMRTEKCEVYITGSSAAMLSREIATQMRGRALSWEIFPFSFREFLDFEGLDAGGPLSTRQRLLVRKAFERYWERGGFPEVAGLHRALRIRIHQEYWGAMLFRDLVERHDVAHPRAVSDLAQRLVDNTASLHSVNRLTSFLQSLGHRAPKSAVSDYVAWFEDAFFLFAVPVFDASLARARTNPKKIYCVDHALVRSVGSGVLVNAGHLLENVVFTALRRSTPRIAYFKGPNGREVDFVAQQPDGSRSLVQVCETLADPRTRRRETNALHRAMAELGARSGTIVTRDEEETIRVDAGSIDVVPAWRFLLDVG